MSFLYIYFYTRYSNRVELGNLQVIIIKTGIKVKVKVCHKNKDFVKSLVSSQWLSLRAFNYIFRNTNFLIFLLTVWNGSVDLEFVYFWSWSSNSTILYCSPTWKIPIFHSVVACPSSRPPAIRKCFDYKY